MRLDWSSFRLWQHQTKALRMAENYLRSRTSGAALVRMPTGTGKTGVIAVLARCHRHSGPVLVVAPWVHVRDQLASEIENGFWGKIGVSPQDWPATILKITPSTLQGATTATVTGQPVYFATIQTLQMIHRGAPSAYEALKRSVSLVLVDEGHREPAPEWATAVRELEKRTILFTATPYRNDHKVFNVDAEHVYAYTHISALRERYIRDVRFVEMDFGTSAADFVRTLLAYYRGPFKKLAPRRATHPRVIIRCETSSEVNDIANRLATAGESVVAVHERFEDDDEDFLYQNVPSPSITTATFWIHQNKLIEGIDDPDFCLLAIFRPFGNGRALVQQVGRVLRNPTRSSGETAYVVTEPEHNQSAFWLNYMRYEQAYENDPAKYEILAMFDEFVAAQPEHQYFEGNYRSRFDVTAADAHEHFHYPLSARIFRAKRTFRLDDCAEQVAEEWHAQDLDVRGIRKPDGNTRVIPYVDIRNSPVLLDQVLVQFSPGFTILRQVGSFVFFYDSLRSSTQYLSLHASPVEPSLLERLFAGTRSRISQVSLLNTDLGRHSVRRRVVYARSIDQIAPGLADHSNVCSTALGYSNPKKEELRRRYVGFTRGRVSDPSSVAHTFHDYVAWTAAVAADLQRDRSASRAFDRYAEFTVPPLDPTPANILLDLEDVADSFQTVATVGGRSVPLLPEDVCYDVEGGAFTLRANSKAYHVRIGYDPEKATYGLECPQLERDFVRVDAPGRASRRTLTAYLNNTQAFRIVTRTRSVIYAHSRFYAPRLALGGHGQRKRVELLRILVPVRKLASLTSEKGPAGSARGAGWSRSSIFNLVDTMGRGTELERHLAGVDALICDDQGRELADFIALDTRASRLILVHVKASDRPTIRSASAFHAVCSQAIKNLDLIHPFSALPSRNTAKWATPWRDKRIGHVNSRVRRGTWSAAEAWNRIEEVVRNPAATREVWIIVGRSFSRAAFERAAGQVTPPAEVVQLLYLLQSTWGAVSSVGGVFKVFCSP